MAVLTLQQRLHTMHNPSTAGAKGNTSSFSICFFLLNRQRIPKVDNLAEPAMWSLPAPSLTPGPLLTRRCGVTFGLLSIPFPGPLLAWYRRAAPTRS